jgi:hypothetical protein
METSIKTLCVCIAKKEKEKVRVEKELRIIEDFEEKSLNFHTLEILNRLYKQIKTTPTF